MEHTFRQVTHSDFAAINKLCVEAYEEFKPAVGEANWERMRDTLTRTSDLSKSGELILAEDSTGLLGIVVYVPAGTSDGVNIPTEWASIRMLAVSPRSRGRGIGRKLTQECIDRARRNGAEAIGLTTAAMMTVAQPMYERMGFVKDADLGTRFGVNEARYVLILKQSTPPNV